MALKKNPLNDGKVEGSQHLPRFDKNEFEPQAKLEVKSMQTQFKIMKWAVAKCPSIELKIMGESVPSLLDSSSMVSLMWQDHFNRYFRLQLGPAEGSVADAHHLFDLTSARGGAIPLSRYVELDVVKLAYQEFLKKYNIDVFEDFECLDGVNPLLFSQLCIYYYADVVPAVVNEICDEDGLIYTEEVTKNKKGNVTDKKNTKIS